VATTHASRHGALVKASDLGPEAGRRWWIFLVTGGMWILFALIVFRLDLDTVTAIGIVVGAVCIAGGVNEFLRVGVSSRGWKVAHAVFGVLFILVGILALAYPHRTFVELAAIFSFFLAFKGIFDIFISLAMRRELEIWWLQLMIGVVELLLGFWAAGNFGREAVLLVVWVGAAALARGVMEIALAIQLYGLREDVEQLREDIEPRQPRPA
jgi:uncharacterized membrane protein HdeD (DUF308 family)